MSRGFWNFSVIQNKGWCGRVCVTSYRFMRLLYSSNFLVENMEDSVSQGNPGNYSKSKSSSESTISNAFCNDKRHHLHNHDSIARNNTEDFYFESDHPALKTNSDYKTLLRAIFTLETQRKQAILDLDCLNELQDKALADPISFVKNLQKRKLEVPAQQQIHQLPVIDWSKYALSANSSAFGHKQTRMSTKVPNDFGDNESNGKRNDAETKQKGNQYWTAEEQKKLEELLVEFPPEKTEARRWKKIASQLENRTPVQVASRVQKYFIKLTRAGLPIPGRMPNSSHLKKKLRRTVIRQHPSTFLVSHQPPVYMPDDEDDFVYKPEKMVENCVVPMKEVSDEEDITPELQNTEEYQEIMLIKNILRNREISSGKADVGYVPHQNVMHRQPGKFLASHPLQTTDGNSLNSNEISDEDDVSLEFRNTMEYQEIMLIKKIIRDRNKTDDVALLGYICLKCKVYPILGTRWHCTECRTSVDFCSACVD